MKTRILNLFLIVAVFLPALYFTPAQAQTGLNEKGRQLLEGGAFSKAGRQKLGLDPGDAEVAAPAKILRVCPAGQQLDGAPCDASSLAAATRTMTFNTRILMAPGVYAECATIGRDHVTIEGKGATLRGKACAGKAALIVRGGFFTLKDITCEDIAVRDRNGACIRYEGHSLTLENVRFANSENGILGGDKTGDLTIIGSTFHRNGEGGRAHKIYFGSARGRLVIRDTTFTAAKGEGHGVKSGAPELIIENVTIDGTGGQQSRNIDAYNGGVLRISNSTLSKAASDTNNQIIGYDYEGRYKYAVNEITIENSRIDCGRGAYILAGRNSLADAKVVFSNNTITGNCLDRARWGL